MRNADLRAPDQLRHVRARTWALRIDLASLPELTFANAHESGVEPEELVADALSASQALGGRLREQVAGVVVPSAALPGTRNVVLFGARVGSSYLLEPVGPVDIPAGITADDGRPPFSLVDAVRFRGDEHAGLEAWRRGEAYAFPEPPWGL